MTLTKTLIAIGSLAFAIPASAADARVTDANIGAIVVAANQIDIDYGKIALKKSKNKQVRDFAQRMIADHGAVQKSVLDLAGKLKLVPEENTKAKV